MGDVSGAAVRVNRLAAAAREVAADERAPIVAAAALAVLAGGQAAWVALIRADGQGGPLGTGATSGWLVASIVVVLAGLLGTVPLGLRWQRPEAAALIICAANLLSLAAFRIMPAACLVAQLIALYRVGRHGPQLLGVGLALPFLAVALANPARLVIAPAWPGNIAAAILAAALGPAAVCAGTVVRSRSEARQRTAATEAIAQTLLENTARGERARISRELHDVVAHHVSMIAVQAETARLATPGMPAAGAQRLSAIGDTARTALTEMRRLLGVLREDSGAAPADRQPQPGLAQLNDLLDEARDVSGIGARLIVQGWLTSLDPGVELAAYRIVQEALTNARRHAPGAAVDVELRFEDDALRLSIRDDGPGPSVVQPGQLYSGHGLLGMRERAAAVGGELSTGAAPGGGFLVQATLPAGTPGAGPMASTAKAEVTG
jgi:signal transduction histidine kinase